MSLIEVVAAALLLTGNLLVLRWLVGSDSAYEASTPQQAPQPRPQPSRLRRAA